MTDSKSDSTVSDSSASGSFDAENFLQTAAEYLPGAALTILPEDADSQECLAIFYNEAFESCAADDARFLLTAKITQDGQESILSISVTDYDHDPVYELSVALHRPATRKEALQ